MLAMTPELLVAGADTSGTVDTVVPVDVGDNEPS
jgi:hypothetical protein